MKQCPTCSQIYDNTENFCQNDGSTLSVISTEQKTYSTSDAPTMVVPKLVSSEATVIRPGVHPAFAYLTIGLLALLAGGAIMLWLKSDSNSSSISKTDATPASTPTEAKPFVSHTSKEDLREAQEKLQREQQKLEEERKKLEAKKNEISVPPTTRPAQTSGGTWFVVLGSYTKYETEKANQRLQYVQSLGYSATIVDTNNYPGFRGGLYSVVVGPYSKSEAKSQLSRMKSSVSDAYIKSGW
jgi:hypothetical protein